jgi:serine/threonine-protein kinase
MALQAGSKLGQYEILSSLGAGGMGEVYRARDTKLGREVAIKVLLEEVSADPERLARFEREARALAALNHPNVATLHGFFRATPVPGARPERSLESPKTDSPESETEGETSFLVMELVEGETLADRIARGRLPLDEAIPLFVGIAEGLEAAHGKGIVHRDLKPANVKVVSDGRVKVLDFGLAKAVAPSDGAPEALSQSPTLTEVATRRGEILGTAAYMSPEQAQGKAVDKRTDVWSFGCCLWEALAGRRPFEADNAAMVLARVLERDPDWEQLPHGLPRRVRDLLRRCIEKDPGRRVHDIADARIELEDALREPAEELLLDAPSRPALAAGWGAALLAAGLLGGALLGRAFDRPSTADAPSPIVTRLQVPWIGLDDLKGGVLELADISSDGSAVVYQAGTELHLRRLSELTSTRLEGTKGGFAPFFSPTGEWVGFFTMTELKKISVDTGAVESVASVSFGITGTWGPDDTIVYGISGPSGLWRVSAAGGEPEPVTVREPGEGDHDWPTILPGGEHVVFAINGRTWDDSPIVVQSLETGERRTLVEGGSYPRYAASGHLLFARQGALKAVPFDAETQTVGASPVTVLEPLAHDPMEAGHAQFSVSRTGSLLYLRGPTETSSSTPVWVDRSGRYERSGMERGFYEGPISLDPGGTRVALTLRNSRDTSSSIRILDFAPGTSSRLTFDPDFAGGPLWSSQGDLVFHSTRATERAWHLYNRRADGAGQPAPLIQTSLLLLASTPDDTLLVGETLESGLNFDIAMVDLSGEPEVRPLVSTPARERFPDLSPDGKWITYVSDESGREEVYVRPFPNVDDGKWSIPGAGSKPLWSPTGDEIFYRVRNPDRVFAVSVESTEPFRLGPPRLLFEADDYQDLHLRDWSVAPDGRRFLMLQKHEVDYGQFVLVQNWFEELERLVPTS